MYSKTWMDDIGTIHQVIGPGRIHSLSTRAKILRAYLAERAHYECQNCGVREGPAWDDRLEVDHIIPWRDGGTNHPDNLQLLCPKCNKGKRRWERLWRDNDRIGTPNDYRDWIQRWVPSGYAECTFSPDAWPLAGQGGVLNAC